MKINRTKNAIRNIGFGGLLKLYQIVVPFIMRTVMLYYLGIQYLGLSSLFTSILEVLNLVELGVGSAMVFSMYKPIAEDDKEKICALMHLYKLYYRVIGCVVAICGIVIIPFLDVIVTGDIPSDVNIYVLYFLNLGVTVFSYWLFAYKNSLLVAHQRNDVTHKINIVISTVKYIIQIVVLIIWRNYYIYLIVNLLTQIFTNIVSSVVVTRMYPEYIARGKLEKKEIQVINHRVRDLFTAKLGGIIIGPADSIVISAFLGITTLAIYQNYQYIVNSIIGFMTIVFQSCIAGIGNSFVTESDEKNYRDFKNFLFIIMWIITWCTTCLYCLYQPFMMIWVGVDLMLNNIVVAFLCLYFFVFETNQIFIAYKDAAGIWHEDRFRPLVVSISNFVLNLILVKYIGLLGVLLATIISTTIIGMPWLVKNVFKVKFKCSAKPMVLKLAKYAVVTIIATLATRFVSRLFEGWEGWSRLVITGVICCLIPNLICFMFYQKSEEFRETKKIIRNLIKRNFMKNS